jgi:GMP synthase-like glutamine amidotransferase
MQIVVLQHVAFEGAGILLEIFNQDGHHVEIYKLYAADALPNLAELDVIVVMGGPMGVGDAEQFPWLINEKRFLSEAINSGKPILGICLGAQLLADVLGARVYRNAHREIGWFPVTTTPAFRASRFGKVLGDEFIPLHWHGDTFDLPSGAISIGTSAACQCQGFVFEERILALQFHLEMTSVGLSKLVKHCADELIPSAYVQSAEQLLTDEAQFAAMHQRMAELIAVWLQI